MIFEDTAPRTETADLARSSIRTPPAVLSRRALRWEVATVLLVGPALWAWGAFRGLAENIAGAPGGGGSDTLLTEHAAVATTFDVVQWGLLLAPVAVVALLLGRSGHSPRDIGLDGTRLGRDLGWVIPLWVGAAAAQRVATLLFVHGGDFGALYAGSTATVPTVYVAAEIAHSIYAGVLEEVLVLGYLVHRLRLLGWNDGAILTLTVALRAAYHAEYGFSLVGPVAFGLVLGVYYLRKRRLVPVILAHAMYDVLATLRDFGIT